MALFYRFKRETDRPTEGQPITVDSIRKASERLLAFKDKKKVMDHTVVENEQWYKVRHWRYLQKGQGLTPSSAWLFNALTSKHADFMDNLPDATFLPRVQDDEAEADALTAIIPVIMERNGWRECYSETVWQKLKHGTGVYSATWDNKADHGIGDIALSRVDILNFFCDPELQDIQDSSDVFVTKAMTKDQFKSLYPDVDGNLTGSIKPERFETDEKNSANDIVVVDWYYKVQRDGRTLLHFVKYVGDVILFASENEGATYADGFYWHGKYPFVVDTLYPLENSPFGFGLVAVGREPQAQIDQMNKLFLEHLAVGARPRTFISDSLGIKDEDFADLSKTIYRVKGSEITGKVYPIPHPSLDGIYYNIYASKIDELKETTSNRDVSNGSTSSGVTSGAAISALQETGNKTSRDMIGASYHAFEQLMKLVVELVRQFYTEPRYYRLTGQDGTPQYREYQNAGLNRPDRVPEFDIKIKTHRASAFSRVSQNELAVQLYQMGVFNPQIADQALAMLDMMDFEGKDSVVAKVANGQTTYNMMVQMAQEMEKMHAIIAKLTGQIGVTAKAEDQTAPQEEVNLDEQNGASHYTDTITAQATPQM